MLTFHLQDWSLSGVCSADTARKTDLLRPYCYDLLITIRQCCMVNLSMVLAAHIDPTDLLCQHRLLLIMQQHPKLNHSHCQDSCRLPGSLCVKRTQASRL